MRTNKQITDTLNQMDFITLCQTLYGEARGEETQGRLAVVHVILNRVKRNGWMGKTVYDVCMKDQQFSCWNERDPNCDKIKALKWIEAENCGIYHDVKLALNWWKVGEDVTNGATHYHTKYVHPKWSWDRVPCVEIGGHLFYNNME